MSVQSEIAQDAAIAGIDPRWALAIGQVESGYNPRASNPSGAYGPMQLMPQTAQSLGVNPLNPAQNIQGGVALLKQDLARYHNPVTATEAYYGGTDTKNWGPKTRQYVQKVVKAYQGMAKPTANKPLTTQQFVSAMGGGSSGSTVQGAQQTPPAGGQSFTPLTAQQFVGAMTAGASSPSAPSTSSTPASPPKPSTIDQIGTGIERGVHVLTDAPAEALASGVGAAAHALGIAPNWHPGATTKAADQKADAAYKAQYGNAKVFSPVNVANVGTQLGGGGAMLAGGEGLVNAAADALPDVTGANLVRGAVRFATGRGTSGAGIVGKAASLAAQGAGQTAAFDALTGRPVNPGDMAAGAVANPLLAGAGHLVANQVRNALESSLPATTKAARIVGRAINADGGLPTEASAPGDALATVGGTNVQGLTESLANRPGPGRDVVTQYFANLINSHPEQMAKAINAATGSDGDVHDLAANVIAQRSAAAAPKFAATFERIKPTADELSKLEPLISSPEGQKAINTAITTMRRDALGHGRTFNPGDIGLVRNGDQWAIAPDVQSMPALHGIKEGFDDNIEALRDPVTGKLPNTKEVNALAAMRDRFRNSLTEAFPRYKGALDAWSGPSRVLDAARLGRKVFSNDSELTAKRIQGMDPTEKEGFQAGVARAILDKINSVQDGAKVARIFSRPDIRAKVAAAFNDPDAADRFMNLAERMNTQHNVRNTVLGNSRTALRAAQQSHDWAGTAIEAGANTLAGRPHIAALRLLEGLGRHAATQTAPAVDRAVANLLTMQDIPAALRGVQQVQPAAKAALLGDIGTAAGRGSRLVPALTWDANSAAGTAR